MSEPREGRRSDRDGAAASAGDVAALPYAHGGPVLRARLKVEPEDFIVEEVLGFEPTGRGEHAFLIVEKRGANTDWVAKQLARYAGVAPVAVGYAGLKDRHAITRQAYTVALANKPDPDWLGLEHPEFRVLSAIRHDRKLKRGALRGNRFRIRLREVEWIDRPRFDGLVEKIATLGVPNYFGEQRFGRDAGNVEAAKRMFEGERVAPAERSMLLSAARSTIFNHVLARRVEDGSWAQALDGDVFNLDGSGSIFGPEPLDDAIRDRIAAGRIHPTGPMWGRGDLRTTGAVAELEHATADAFDGLARGLERAGLEQERRALRLRVSHLSMDGATGDLSGPPDALAFAFELPAGSYATVVLRELCGQP